MDDTYTWKGGNAEYDDPSQWSLYGISGTPGDVPGDGDTAILSQGTVDIDNLSIGNTTLILSENDFSKPSSLVIDNSVFGPASTLQLTGEIAYVSLIGTDVFEGLIELQSSNPEQEGTLGGMEGPGTLVNDGTISDQSCQLDVDSIVNNGSIVVSGREGNAYLLALVNNAAVEVDANGLVGAESLSGAGTITLNGGALDVYETASADQTVALSGSAADESVIELGYQTEQPYLDGSFQATVSGFDRFDELVIDGGTAAPVVTDAVYADGVLTLSDDGTEVFRFHLAGDYAGDAFTVAKVNNTVAVTTGSVPAPCFARGTLIATVAGPVCVETLRPSDAVVLADGGIADVVWTGHRRQQNADVIRVTAHALGAHVPVRDLVVSDDHGLVVEGVLVPAGLLANGETIRRERRGSVEFWHVELARHAVLLAENAPAESYLDTGNRARFSNCPLAYDAARDAAATEPCAPLVLAGARLEAIWARLSVPA